MESEADVLRKGAEIMSAVIESHGFAFSLDGEGSSSGGTFAHGSWSRRNRKLELHFRLSLGLVTYHIDQIFTDHASFLWAAAGSKRVGKYPGTSDNPLHAFQTLAEDLQTYGAPFLVGSDDELETLLRKANELKKSWESLPPLKRLDVK